MLHPLAEGSIEAHVPVGEQASTQEIILHRAGKARRDLGRALELAIVGIGRGRVLAAGAQPGGCVGDPADEGPGQVSQVDKHDYLPESKVARLHEDAVWKPRLQYTASAAWAHSLDRARSARSPPRRRPATSCSAAGSPAGARALAMLQLGLWAMWSQVAAASLGLDGFLPFLPRRGSATRARWPNQRSHRLGVAAQAERLRATRRESSRPPQRSNWPSAA